MTDFNPEKIKTNVDFIAWSLAKMEHDNRQLSAGAVAGNMSLIMAGQFYDRLNYYRSCLQKNRPAVRSGATS